MQNIILKGSDVAASINEEIIKKLKDRKKIPELAIIRVGEKPDDLAYERGAVKRLDKVGMKHTLFIFDETISNDDFLAEFDRINSDDGIDGILLLRPLPKHINEKEVENRILPSKDVDGISPVNMAKVYAGDDTGFAPCTAEAVIEALKYAHIDLSGKNVTVIGRSLVIGKPAAMLLIKNNATVTVCHTKTSDLPGKCRNADIIIAAAGKAKMVTSDYVRDGQIIIDVGINADEEGNLCGDVDFEEVSKKASVITPVPGGIGSVTTSVLAKHLLRAAADS